MAKNRFLVRAADAGRPAAEWLCERLRLPRRQVQELFRQGRVRIRGVSCHNPAQRLRRGEQVQVQRPAPAARPQPAPREAHGPQPVVRHADEAVVVVDKPPGLTTMRHAEEAAEFGARAGRFLPRTLADLLLALLARDKGLPQTPVRAVHRLDKETSGLVVFARTRQAESHLGRQFRAHSIERLYLAVVRGRAGAGRLESYLVRDRGDGRRGSTTEPGAGQRAVTHVRVLEELGEYTLVECRLETGRTHQVRIHLAEAGTPLCGERVYDRPLHGKPLPDASAAPRVALHAAALGFEHPTSGRRMHWTSPLPRDLSDLVRRLRRQARPGKEADRP
jgi:23S rRNA pseudouridine1911/1915/1917 synthase